MGEELVERNKTYYEELLEEEKKLNLEPLQKELETLKKEQPKDKYSYNKLISEINTALFRISRLESIINNLREPIPSDVEERKKIRDTFAEEVRNAVPDNMPIVFHGVNSIGIVEDIIKSGGLFTPKDRGIEYISYATKIDVTTKNDISTSVQFADSLVPYILPYGAIFVFFPAEKDYDRVISCNSSLLDPGVDSVNFRESPDRLLAIVTTNENIDRLKKVAVESGIDESKIITHQNFLDLCNQKNNGFKR